MPLRPIVRTDSLEDKPIPEDQAPSPTAERIRNIFSHVKTVWSISMSLLGLRPRTPAGLSDVETEVYDELIEVLNNRAITGRKPPRLVVITDLAKDYDDLMAMVMLAELQRLGLVELIAFVANLAPARNRARFGRGALDLLGLQEIPIAIGSKGSDKHHKVNDYEFKQCAFMADSHAAAGFEKGEDLLVRVFKEAVEENRKVTLVLISSLMDISQFAHKYPDLLKEAVEHISVQGGMYRDKGELKADDYAANNNFSPSHALHFTKYIQENNVPTTVYTKVAAFDTKIYSQFFAELAATGHPLGLHLRKTQLAQDVNFYTDTMDERTRFRPFMTQRWFLRNKSTWFNEGHSEDPAVEPYPHPEQVGPYLTVVVAYDALAALGAAGDDVLERLQVLKPDTEGETCRIVGVCPTPDTPDVIEDSGVYGDRMATVIKAIVKGSLLSSQQELPRYT
jgi:hypothetical protein